MSEPAVERVRRAYRAPKRSAAALRTRRRVRGAAAELFLESGYAATSVRAVALAAGVSEKTIYLQFATKAALLREVVEATFAGGDDAVPGADRPWFAEILSEPRPLPKLELIAEAAVSLHRRTGALLTMARTAAAADPEVAAQLRDGERGRRSDMTSLAESLESAGLVPADLGRSWAASVLFVLLGPETWHLVRAGLRYDEDQYGDWLLATLERTFRA